MVSSSVSITPGVNAVAFGDALTAKLDQLEAGLPIGYVLASSLFGSTEIAYNVFETFRGAEAGAAVFARGEGLWRGDGEFFFNCTNGGLSPDGPARDGEVEDYRLELSPAGKGSGSFSRRTIVSAAAWVSVTSSRVSPWRPNMASRSASSKPPTEKPMRKDHTG